MKSVQTERKQSLLGALLQAVYWADESLQESLLASGFERIPRTWSMVMVNISNGVRRPIRIAENVGISRQAIQKTLREMSHAGLIDIIPDPEDRRATVVSFSPRGRPIQEAARHIMGEIERELEQRVGRKQVQQLHDTLEKDWGALVVIEDD